MSEHDIAIIGMAARLPGAPSIEAFWENLCGGVESIRPLTDSELRDAGVSVEMLADPAYVKVCPVLEDVDQFDAGFFGLSPRDAEVMDPAHRLFLEVAWEAMEHAGRTGLPDEDTVGVFAGSGASYYLMDHLRRDPRLMRSMGEFLLRHTNNDVNFLSSRVSYEMDLRGPSINVQTACSTVLVAVHLACDSIRRGECSIALVGGSTVLIPDRHGYLYQEGEILSPDGHCRPFDARSTGTVFGSGSGCLVLKRLSAALDDGDTIHAVIKGSAVNNDGAVRVGFLAPGVDGQAAVVGRAIDDAGVSAESITYIEAHGTGTVVGDPIEVAALNQAFAARTQKRRYCAIGSVKSNIGHLGEAAGVASLIKAVLALKHRQIPATLGFERPNPQIDFDDSPFFVSDQLQPWIATGPRRCGVTALGAGGTNCHVILEEAPRPIAGEGARDLQLVTLSAGTPGALERARHRLADALDADPALDLADAAYTLAVGRRALPHRHVAVVQHREQAIALLRELATRQSVAPVADTGAPRMVFMFPGGGAQYVRMGADLYAAEPVFREAIDACLTVVNARLGRDLGAVMFANDAQRMEASSELERPSLTLPALFTSEYALARLFHSWGVQPTAMLGHSMGEYVAACLADVMSLEDALQMVMLRGRLFESTTTGAMLSVPLPEAELRRVMSDDLSIAAVNAAELCVASGPVEAIEALARQLAARDIECTRIRIDVAAHSALLDPVLAEFGQFCRTITLHPPTVPILSNVTGDWMTAQQATDPEYWVRHLRSTVRFAKCLETLRAEGEPLLVEIGPGRTLSMLARAQRTPARWAFSSMRHPEDESNDVAVALSTLGSLWMVGAHIDWPAFYDGQLRNRVPLPTYSWDHERHWIAAPTDDEAAPRVVVNTETSVTARRDEVADWFERPTWRHTVSPSRAAASAERVLLFTERGGIGPDIVAQFAAADRRVLSVYAGSDWHQDGDHFTIRPAAREDYERLLKAVAIEGSLPTRVVHAWSVTEPSASGDLSFTLEHGFHSVYAFGQALANESPDAAMTVFAVTSHLQRVGGESVLDPAKALVLGPARVMPREFPNVRTRAIDVVLPTAPTHRVRLAAQLVTEVLSASQADTVALRGMDRYEQHLEALHLQQLSARLRRHGVYLITGGLGGIGFVLASYLAKAYQAKLVLIGRGATAARSRAQVDALEAAGAEVEVVQADVTDEAQMRAAVRRAGERFGELNGVFHAAGVLDDGLFPFKSRERAERVLAPKVLGTQVLDRALGAAPLDLLVLFSSISSVAGLAGQSDYTAANAFLDAFAHERSARDGSFVVAINWSAWRDVGMAAGIAAASGHDGTSAPEHPLLGRRLWAGDGSELFASELFASELSAASHWVIAEHRIRGGRSLMPGTGHLEIVRAAAQSRPEPGILEIGDLTFMSPLVVPDDASREMRVHVARRGDGRRTIAIAGQSRTDDGSIGWREHVTATAGFVEVPQPPALDLPAIAMRCSNRVDTFVPDQESVNMAFGPRWKNLQSIRYGQQEALVTLELPVAFRGDLDAYLLHPSLMDMATGRCEALVPGFDPATDFYVPLSYTRVRVFAPLPARCVSHVRVAANDFDPRDLLVFDATICDEHGRVLVEVEEFVMSRVTDKGQLHGDGSRGEARRAHARFDLPTTVAVLPPMVQRLDAGIRSAEGMQALEQILNGPVMAQVFATPEPVAVLIESLRRPPERARPSAVAAAENPLQSVGEVETVLATHEAVKDCAVLRRLNRQGEPKLVAYPVFHPGARATSSDLRRFLKARLSEALVPSTYIELDALPRSSDGVVDCAALPDPFGVVDDYVAPHTSSEVLIADIWMDILGVGRVSIHDNFFDAGGHSLLAVRVIVRIDKRIGVRLSQAIMVLQTLGQIAAECDRRLATVGSTSP